MNEFASANYTVGQLNAVVKLLKKQGGEDGVDRFLRGELMVFEPTRSWREEDGVIYFSVESDGTTGEAWITRLESKGFRVGDYAKQVLRSPDFKPTSGVTTEIAILKGTLFEDDRITKKIRDGIVSTGSRSSCRKSALNPKTLGISVPLVLSLSPVPIRRSRAKFFHKNKIQNICIDHIGQSYVWACMGNSA